MATDLKPVMLKVLATNPDVLMGNSYMGDAILQIKAIVEVGLRPKFI